jgi:hypothetical protein
MQKMFRSEVAEADMLSPCNLNFILNLNQLLLKEKILRNQPKLQILWTFLENEVEAKVNCQEVQELD